jgi:hypothetical protein
MRITIILYLFLFVSIQHLSVAQANLVQNGDFETYTCCPHNVVPTGDLVCATPWFGAQCSPDYFNVCDTAFLGVPSNSWGTQFPHSGNAYAGFYTYNFSQANSSRDYIECQLISVLTAGNKYMVSFHVSLADNSNYATNTVGVYFSSSQVTGSNCNLLNYTAQIQNTSSNPLTDKINWILIQDTLTATGGEQYITIGNFATDIISNPQFVGTFGLNGTYYYIDDVSVIDLGPTGMKENSIEKDAITVYPNPNSGILSFASGNKGNSVCKAELYNVTGTLVIQQNLELNHGTGELNIHADNGMYLLRVYAQDGSVGTYKVILNK